MRDAHIIWSRITPYRQSFTTMIDDGGMRVLLSLKKFGRGFAEYQPWTP